MSLVYLKNKQNGVTYVYESIGYWDKEKKQARNKRICIGKLDPDTGGIVPSKRLLAADTSEVARRGPIPSIECRRSFYGAAHLLDSIGEKLGVTEDLKRSFPDSYKQILSIAYYLGLPEQATHIASTHAICVACSGSPNLAGIQAKEHPVFASLCDLVLDRFGNRSLF